MCALRCSKGWARHDTNPVMQTGSTGFLDYIIPYMPGSFRRCSKISVTKQVSCRLFMEKCLLLLAPVDFHSPLPHRMHTVLLPPAPPNREGPRMVSSRTKSLDSGGFDSSRFLTSSGGIPRSTGSFPEM